MSKIKNFFGKLAKGFKGLKRWKKILIVTFGVIATLALAVFITVNVLISSGKVSLYKDATSEEVNMSGNKVIVDKEDDKHVMVDGDGNIIINSGEESVTNGENLGENVTNGNVSEENSTSGNNSNGGNSSEQQTYPEINFDAQTGTATMNGEKYKYNKNLINFLVLGIDRDTEAVDGGIGSRSGQSDSIFLVTLNPDTKEMEMLTIHRNAIVLLETYDTNDKFSGYAYGQLCLQHAYATNMSTANKRTMKVVSELLYDLPIHSVSSINLAGVSDLNDAIGGVTLESLETFTMNGYKFTKGQPVTLNGPRAYCYVRYRDLYRKNTAAERMARQKQYMTAMANKTISELKSNPLKVVDVYNVVSKYVVTDLSIDEITYLGSEIAGYTLKGMYSLSGQPSTDPKWKYERIYLDENMVKQYVIEHFCEKQ